MLENLIPVSDSHSISRVVATVFVPQAFLKPEDVFENVKNAEGFKYYQKKTVLKSRTININQDSFGITNDRVNGFLFEGYDDLGSIENIFKVENINKNQSTLGIENRKYKGWENFKDHIERDFGTFGSRNDFYIEAISLNYRDEFKWNSTQKIQIEKIFNIESELLNKKFFTSINGTFILISQGNLNPDMYEERTEISFNNDLKRITVDHHYAIRFKEIRLFSKIENNLSTLYDQPHKENKNILKDILTKDTQELINLK